jgi:hypothetical protein
MADDMADGIENVLECRLEQVGRELTVAGDENPSLPRNWCRG